MHTDRPTAEDVLAPSPVPWPQLALGSLICLLPLLLLLRPAPQTAAWEAVGLPGRRVMHLAAGSAGGVPLFYAWTPTGGLLQGSLTSVGGQPERSLWRPVGRDLPGGSLWGAPELRRLLVAPNNGRLLLAVMTANDRSDLYRSTDGGGAWQLLRSLVNSPHDPVLAFGPHGEVYLADGNRLLWESGGLWLETPPWPAEAGAAVTLIVHDRSQPGLQSGSAPPLLVGAERGVILRLQTPSPAAWETITLPTPAPVSLLAVADSLFAWSAGTLFASADAGVTWQGISQPFDGVAAPILLTGYGEPAALYLAAGQGLFASADGGRSWRALDGSPHSRPFRHIYALALDPRPGNRLLVAGDQGIWRLNDAPAQTPR